ncbi:MAG: tetratricopeptide repeat protein, partial [Candidatus Omnitrophota bacterium]
MNRNTLRLIFVLFIVLVGVAIYANSLDNGFMLDDRYVVKDNTFIGDFSNLKYLFDRDHFFTGTKEGTYRPVTTITYFIDTVIWQYRPFGYHLTNVLLHVLNGVMLYLMLRALLGDRTENTRMPERGVWSASELIPFAAAVLFIVHPVQTETVNNVGTRHEEVMTLFYLLGIWSYLKGSDIKGYKSHLMYALSIASYGLSCFSKEMGFTLPAVLLLCDIYRDGGFKVTRLPKYAGYVAVAIVFLYVRFALMVYPGEAGSGFFNLSRLLLSGQMIMTYIGLLLFPLRLSAEYAFGDMFPENTPAALTNPGFFIPVVVLIAVIFLVIAIRKKAPLMFFGAAWFFITILPVSNIFFRLMQFPIRERYIYLPCIGFCIFLAAGLWRLSKVKGIGSYRYGRIVLAAVFLLLTVFYSVRVHARNFDWKDAVSLWSATSVTSPGSYRVHYNLGKGYQYERGNTEKAIESFKKSLSLKDFAMTHDALGLVYYQQGQYEEALKELQKAKSLEPTLGTVYYHLGLLYLAMEKYDNAISVEEEGLKVAELRGGNVFKYLYNPMPYADMHFVIGVARFHKGELDEAIRQLHETIKLDPAYPDIQYYLGYSLLKTGRLEEAEKVLIEGVRLYPEDPRLR